MRPVDKKTENKIHNPHDKFFRELFSRKEEAKNFLQGVLPLDLIRKLDLNSLEIEKTSYLDEYLQTYFSDMVYTCTYNDQVPIKVAFLFEHKSYFPTEMPIQLQLLRYMLALWEHNLKQQSPLVPIIPIVLYHGKRQWEQKPLAHFFGEQLGLMLEGQLARFLPGFDYILKDLSAYPDEEIKALFSLVSLQTALLIMKKIFDTTLAEEIQKIGDAFNELLETKSGEKFYRTILLYLYNGTTIDKQVIIMNMQKVSTKAGALAQSAAEQLRKEGREEEKLQLIHNMILSQLLSYEQIAAIAGVDRAWVEKIAQQMQEKI